MKKIIVFCLLLVVMGCGKGQPWDTYRGEECCRDHGGGGVCEKIFRVQPNGKYGLDDHGRIKCDGRDARGNSYYCPGECK